MRLSRPAYALFVTELGSCGIAWKTSGPAAAPVVCGFQLPEVTPEQTENRLRDKIAAERTPEVPPQIRDIIERVKLHLTGKMQDFSDIELALDDVATFTQQIYQAARTIPAGRTMTYGELAAAAGHAGTAQAVGTAMRKNPIPLIIPCHRVLAAGGKPGGFSAHGGLATKAKLLELEGASVPAFQQLSLEI